MVFQTGLLLPAPFPGDHLGAGQRAPFVGALERQREDLGDTRHWRPAQIGRLLNSQNSPFTTENFRTPHQNQIREKDDEEPFAHVLLQWCWGLNNPVFAKVLPNGWLPHLLQKHLLARSLPFRHVALFLSFSSFSAVSYSPCHDFLLEYIGGKYKLERCI